MKIYFFWPFNVPISLNSTEPCEIFSVLQKHPKVELVNDFDECDYVIYMNIYRNILNLPYIERSSLNIEAVQKMYNFKDHHKEVIIDYNDWTDLRNVPANILQNVYKYFKRSVVYKPGCQNAPWFINDGNVINSELGSENAKITYPREILPINYGIRTDYIEYDKDYKQSGYIYDVCCMFEGYAWEGGLRSVVPHIVRQYEGIKKYVGMIKMENNLDRYANINTLYYGVMKHSKIIVTANPTNHEGDFRLWEALLTGNLVLCDKMLTTEMHKHPLVNGKHLVFYDDVNNLISLLQYYLFHTDESKQIGKSGREHVLKYHKFSDRVDEILEHLI
tara:strand:+ start:4795 stop:5793 length:999 start_codon:yes stop_codon:yes gene_type:complete